MIDYLKVLVNGIVIPDLRNNKYLNFYSHVNTSTGEIKTINRNNKYRCPGERAEYKGLEFIIYESGKVFIRGSLHKYWNNGKHNYNDFNLVALLEVLKDIQDKFDIKPHQMKLNALEIGVNITPPVKTTEVLKYCFLHSTVAFKRILVSNEGEYIQAQHSQYLIKIYDKARHYKAQGYDVKDEILRFEIKFLKMEKLKKHGIYTFQDVIDYGLENFVPLLVEEWKRVLFYDFTIESKSKSILNYKNPIYWQELTSRRSAFQKHKSKLSELIRLNSLNIGNQIEILIEEKGNSLSCKGMHIDQDYEVLQDIKKEEEGMHINPLYIWSEQIPVKEEIRTCVITGLPISMQREESILLSHSGLYELLKINPEQFEEVKRVFLSNKWIDSDIKVQIREIAHNIRNKKSNIERKQKRIYPTDNYRLFDIK